MKITILGLFSVFFLLSGCSTIKSHVSGKTSYRAKKEIYHSRRRQNREEYLSRPYVVLISIDGFRHDYLDKFEAPNLKALRSRGSYAESMIPTFPSKTFPNHYTIVTGLESGHHGIVDNFFKDPVNDHYYKMTDPKSVQSENWYGGVPVWPALEAKGLLTASLFWPGSEAPIAGYLPTYYFNYEHNYPNEKRVQQVVEWLRHPLKTRPHFINLYFSDVDSMGHQYGAESMQVRKAVKEIDLQIGDLVRDIDALGLPVTYIVVSDHGMRDIKSPIYLQDLLLTDSIDMFEASNYGPVVFLYSSGPSSTYRNFRWIKSHEKNFKVYRRKALPEKWAHLRKQERAGDLVLVAEPGFVFAKKDTKSNSLATHGWDPQIDDQMRGIFIIAGKGVRVGRKLPAIRNSDVYPVFMKLLGVEFDHKIDGSLKPFSKILY